MKRQNNYETSGKYGATKETNKTSIMDPEEIQIYQCSIKDSE
jgi:hypothetical protein